MSVSVIEIIDQLEGLVANGRRIVFSAAVMVNEDEVLELIDRARMDLPDEIKQAHQLLEEQRRLTGEAEATARAMVTAAKEEAMRMVSAARVEAEAVERAAGERAVLLVSETEVVRAANSHGQQVVADAERVAGEIRDQADAYARDVMAKLEAQLAKMMSTVRKGIEQLSSD
ncbi:MAG TPA: hypothetical protein VG266_04635 [Candidatus Dormibacteraeota bacterium]|nr:hypothetical protein [Candidatus Dormibacteraeota bacterium]